MHPPDPAEPPLGAALDTVTDRIARRLAGRLDRLLANVADLEELERQIAELTQEVHDAMSEGGA